uniref:LysM domain receptor-like kinase 4 n=1 Tax=Nicotiana tabacum TaxID=4097 RepID=A0A1S3Z839_TOBAC|nr:PREDICTED: lysM domain receptor-like kinase 4 [Nicotiana tabacum]
MLEQNAYHLNFNLYVMNFQWLLVICICISSSYGQQFYDSTSCFSNISSPGTRYTCTSLNDSCQTFLIYRANQDFTTISDVSYLFGFSPDVLLTLNNVTSSSQILEIVPIQCSCLGESFQANVSYHATTNTKFDDVACGVFEGLVKSITLLEKNISKKTNISDVNYDIKAGTELLMPFFDVGLNYLVTFPFISGDDT